MYSSYRSCDPFNQGETEENPFESFTASAQPSLRTLTLTRQNRCTWEPSPGDLNFDTAEEVETYDMTHAAPTWGTDRQGPEVPKLPTNLPEGSSNIANGNDSDGDNDPPECNGEDELAQGDRMFLMLTQAITDLTHTTRDACQAAPRPKPPHRKV